MNEKHRRKANCTRGTEGNGARVRNGKLHKQADILRRLDATFDCERRTAKASTFFCRFSSSAIILCANKVQAGGDNTLI